MQPNAGVGWLLRKTTPAPIYGTRAFAGARTDRLGVASKRQRHPSKPTNPPSRTIVSLVPKTDNPSSASVLADEDWRTTRHSDQAPGRPLSRGDALIISIPSAAAGKSQCWRSRHSAGEIAQLVAGV